MSLNVDGLLTEQVNPATAEIDLMTTEEILRLINDQDKTVATAVEPEIPNITAAVDKITAAVKNGGRLIYIGAGSSGRLGVLDAAECPPTFGVDPGLVIGLIAGGHVALASAAEGAEDTEDTAREDLVALGLTSRDVLVGIAASGRTPYVKAGLEYGNSLGAFTVAVSCTPDPEIGAVAKLAITPLVGPEVITGSTRLKAGTATKLVLNMLTTAVMIRSGKVYGNLMVDVRPTNDKLWERAKRMVAEAAGATREQAGAALEAAGKNAKTAIVMLKCGCLADEAQRRLAAADGFIRKAINQTEKENNK
ncbi:MAG: N-acetylmuramic acid 6-phosphate etherase [Negativicutes bacterium]|nr:N-acetylmuramic acid 6-phosphate etherase [Negativicutes bacterium]